MPKKYLLKASNVTIYVGDSQDLATAVWTELPEVFNLERGGEDVEVVDVTSFSSADDKREELNSFSAFTDGTLEFYELIGNAVQQQIIDGLGGDPIALRATKTDGENTRTIDALFNVRGETEPLAPGEAASRAFTIRRTGAPIEAIAANP